MYQYIYKTPSHIIINGTFPLPNGGSLSSGKFSRLFKYPAWEYPGEREEKKVEIINRLNQFVRNGDALVFKIDKAHISQFPSKFPQKRNTKAFPLELEVTKWNLCTAPR